MNTKISDLKRGDCFTIPDDCDGYEPMQEERAAPLLNNGFAEVRIRRALHWARRLTNAVEETFAVDPAVIQLAKGYYSNRKKQLVDGVEETEWQKSKMFSQKDIENILALMKVGVGSQAKDLARWEKDRQSLLDFISSINHHEDRWELLFKCKHSVS